MRDHFPDVDGDNTLKGYDNDPDLRDFLIVVQNVLRVSIAIDDAFPHRSAFISLIKEVFVEKAESIMRTKSRQPSYLLYQSVATHQHY